jgi:uncharacterized membrane protein
MSRRTRIRAFGSSAFVAVAGALCWALVNGVAGLIVGATLLALGLGAIVLLVFLEVGLSEDHARAREEQQQRRPPRRPG